MNGKPVFTVPAKTIINFKSGFQMKLLCDGPTFSAGTACNFSCSYCYVPDAMRKQKDLLEKQGVMGAHEDIVIRREYPLEILHSQLTQGLRGGGKKYKFESDTNDTRVIYGSPLVDVAGNMELVKETIEICKYILGVTHWQIRLLSKSNLLPKVAEELEDFKERMIFGVSTGTLDDGIAKAIEVGTALPSKRLKSLHWLQDNGFRTFGMICPSLPPYGRGHLQFSEEMAKALRPDKMEHVWAEVINVRGESFTRTIKALQDGGHWSQAEALEWMRNKDQWEGWARLTFLAHADVFTRPGQLRFLQYVTKDTREWWEARQNLGAVIL